MKLCEKLLLYVSNELSPQETLEFKDHLKTCVTCQREYSFVKRVEEATATPPSVPSNVMDSLLNKTSHKISWFTTWRKILIGASIVGISLFTILMNFKSTDVKFDAQEIVAYMNTSVDNDYATFANELTALEDNF